MNNPSRVLSFPSAVPRPVNGAAPLAGGAFDPLLGSSPAITTLRAQLVRIAPYARVACFYGAPDCGDLAAAYALHERSQLSEAGLQVLSGSEAEAVFAEPPIQASESAAVYLPEFARLTRTAQLNLLRRMRSRGGHSFLLIAFCTSELRSLVGAGTLLPELAGSLGAVRLKLPSLAERREDIPQLVQALLQRLAGEMAISPPHLNADFLEAASSHAWPGNLLQLENTLRVLQAKAPQVLCAEDLHTALDQQHREAPAPVLSAETRMVRLEMIVQEHIRSVLLGCGGNKLRAAEVLGISRSTLYRMLDAQGALSLPIAS